MATSVKSKTPVYSVEDHITWSRLFARQNAIVKKYACKEFLTGSKKLGLDKKHVPDAKLVSKRIKKMSGWTLSDCGNKTVSIKDWFEAMDKRSFPVTDYIRPAKDFDYTPKPDLFHEYFGHLPYFTDKKFAALAQKFGAMCKHADKRQMMQISRIWSLGVEFGVIKEHGKIKLLGAGLLSSYGECLHAVKMIKEGRVVPFELNKVIATPGRAFEWHKKFFLVNSVDEIADALTVYGKREGLI